MPQLSNQPFLTKGDRYPDHVCLFLHGLGGGIYEMQPLAQTLQKKGFSTCGILYPGHDQDVKKMPASKWEAWYDHIQATFAQLKTTHKKVSLIGFSTGCPLALKLTQDSPNHEIESLILMAPYLKIKRYPLLPPPEWLVYSLGYVLTDLPRLTLPIKDKAMLKAAKAAAFFKTFNMAAVRSANELIQSIKPHLEEVKQPTLIFQAKGDSVVDPSGAQYLYDHLGSANKSLKWLSQSDHIIPLDQDREEIIQQTTSFLETLETGGDRNG